MKPLTMLINMLIITSLLLFFRFDTSYKQQLLVKNPMAWKLEEKHF